MTSPKHTSSDLVEWCSQDLPCARYQALEAENERLRERVKQLSEGWDAMGVKGQAIIDRLQAENNELREVLRDVTPPAYFGESEQAKAWWAKARAALEARHD